MAKYIGAKCKLCRREGMKLFLKGTKCQMAKCILERRNYPPGMHRTSRPKSTNYGLQLREKQRLRRIYGLLEKQFLLTFQKASRKKGITGEILLQLLECRIDSIVYLIGFALSRAQGRQLVRAGHILINHRRVTIPSYIVKQGDTIEIADNEKTRRLCSDNLKAAEQREKQSWIEYDPEKMRAQILRLPTREEIGAPINESLIVELYSK